MGKMKDPPALKARFSVRSVPGAVPSIDWVDIAKTAIASGAFVFATGLIAVASAATLRIGPFNYATANEANISVILATTTASAKSPDFATAATAPAPFPTMLIVADPGADAWQRMLSGEPTLPRTMPIQTATVSIAPPPVTVPAFAAGMSPSPPAWMMLSAIRGIWGWGAASVVTSAAQESLFGKAADAAEPADSPPPAPAPTLDTAPPTATVKPLPDQPRAASIPPATTPPSTPPVSVARPPVTALPIVTSPTPPVVQPPTQPSNGGQDDAPPVPTSPVPEPASWIGFIIGFGLIGLARRRSVAGASRSVST
jgi:hypothetical protein